MQSSHPLVVDDAETRHEARTIRVPILYRGMRFAQTDDLKVAVEQFYAAQGKGVKHGQSGSRQREFRCSGSKFMEGTRKHVGCLAVIRATRQANNDWRISSMETSHRNCTGIKRKVSVATAGRIASEIVATVPNITGRELKIEIESRIGGTLSLRSAHRAKRAALARGRVTLLRQGHTDLRQFLSKLAAASPGTIVDFEEDDDHTFRRYFLMLPKTVRIVTESVPKLFSLDKIRLEGKGMAVVLSCRTSENEVVQAATAIVHEEDVRCYQYLLRNCKRHPEMREFLTSAETTCFYAGDQQEAISALASETPQVQQRWCLFRIINSYTPDISPECFSKVLDAARAPTFDLFQECMDIVNAIEPATFAALKSIPLPFWTHHASPGHTVILDQVSSHAKELTSGVLDSEARKLPILELLEHITRSTSEQFTEREIQLPGYRYGYTNFAVGTYQRERHQGERLTAYAVGYSMYVVQDPNQAERPNRVNMIFSDQGGPDCACTCNFPARFKVPCRHLFAAAKVIARVDDCVQFLDENYGASKFRMLCSEEPVEIMCPNLPELERDTSLKSLQGIEGRGSQLRNLKAPLEGHRTSEEFIGTSVYNPSVSGTHSHYQKYLTRADSGDEESDSESEIEFTMYPTRPELERDTSLKSLQGNDDYTSQLGNLKAPLEAQGTSEEFIGASVYNPSVPGTHSHHQKYLARADSGVEESDPESATDITMCPMLPEQERGTFLKSLKGTEEYASQLGNMKAPLRAQRTYGEFTGESVYQPSVPGTYFHHQNYLTSAGSGEEVDLECETDFASGAAADDAHQVPWDMALNMSMAGHPGFHGTIPNGSMPWNVN